MSSRSYVQVLYKYYNKFVLILQIQKNIFLHKNVYH